MLLGLVQQGEFTLLIHLILEPDWTGLREGRFQASLGAAERVTKLATRYLKEKQTL